MDARDDDDRESWGNRRHGPHGLEPGHPGGKAAPHVREASTPLPPERVGRGIEPLADSSREPRHHLGANPPGKGLDMTPRSSKDLSETGTHTRPGRLDPAP